FSTSWRERGDLRILSRPWLQLPDDRRAGSDRTRTTQTITGGSRAASVFGNTLQVTARVCPRNTLAPRASMGARQLAKLLCESSVGLRSTPRNAKNVGCRYCNSSRHHVRSSRGCLFQQLLVMWVNCSL